MRNCYYHKQINYLEKAKQLPTNQTIEQAYAMQGYKSALSILLFGMIPYKYKGEN